MDHQPCSTNDMNSPRVTGVRQQMRGYQPGHKCNSPSLACSPIARAHHMFNTHNQQRLTLLDCMGDHVVMTHAKQTNHILYYYCILYHYISQRMRNCLALQSKDRVTFFPSGVPTSATSTSTSLPLGLLQLPGTRDPPYT